VEDVEELLGAWLCDALVENPTNASSLGVTDHDCELGDFSADGFERRARAARMWASRTAQLGTEVLSEDQLVDVALLRSHLAGEVVLEGWQNWKRDPEVYLGPCLWGPAILFLHRLRPEAELVEAAVARLRQVPSVLAHAMAQLDADMASPVVVARSVGSAHGGAVFLKESLPGEVASPRLRERLSEAAEEAAEALVGFGGYLCELQAKARGSFAIGEERYSALLAQRELLSIDAGALRAIGERAWAALDIEMAELAGQVQPGASGWREVVATMVADHPESPEELVSGYSAACEKARAFLVERGLVTLPEGERCSVRPSPEFLRPTLAVACYQSPPAFADGGQGYFFVPFPPSGATAEEVDQLLCDNSWSAIPTVAVHEAYPGHHWQGTWSNRTPRALRKVISTPYFLEGWALYAEAMMRRQGFFDTPRQELAHLDARIFRAARIVVDTSLHCGEWGPDEAVDYVLSHTSLTPTVARAEVARYCAWPTQAAAYMVGALELERLCERWLAEGRGGLREFHDTVAASPGLPLPLAGRALFGPEVPPARAVRAPQRGAATPS
jgi:uncharacterized protein (DUF885 family)